MPLSMLSRLIESPEFQREVSGMILDEIIERPCLGQSINGPIRTEVVDYEYTAPIVFGQPKGEGLRYDLAFESRGVSSGLCKTSEGGEYTFARDGAVLGTVRVELGPDALQLARIVDILDGTIIEIIIDKVDVDDFATAAVPPEAFAGES